ncbi:kinase-like protein [Viridothelium virens]|uniref:Kinase-like protein n=1 Tax=Viridothelium virens TaxID=1048519 RepID=A0A6A6H6Z4_VIRVR|nr:kinase-like protein [Viridothelium virens]
MTPQEEFRSEATTAELERAAYIQKAEQYAQKQYNLEQRMASSTKNANQAERGDESETSLAEPHKLNFNTLASSASNQPTRPSPVPGSYHQQLLAQVKTMGSDVVPSRSHEPVNKTAKVCSTLSGPPKTLSTTSRPSLIQGTADHSGSSTTSGSGNSLPTKILNAKSVPPNIAHAKIRPEENLTGSGRFDNPSYQTGKETAVTEGSKEGPLAAKSPNSSRHRLQEIESQLREIIPLGSTDQVLTLSDNDFERLATILAKAGKEEWSIRPRTFAILRMINAVDLMDEFVQKNCLDIALPYSSGNIPQSLSSKQKALFLKSQSSVMNKEAQSIEGGATAKHANFLESVDRRHLECHERHGKGGTGEVHRVVSKLSGRVYVRKRLKRRETFEASVAALNFFKQKVGIMKQLKHRHLIRYIGSYTDPEYVGILMAPVGDMDFKVFLSQKSLLSYDYACIREAFGCLCSAIMYMHSEKKRHKDIKPENIIVRERKVFLTDFGLAVIGRW